MTVGLSTTAIFGDLVGYFFGHFRDRPKARSIIWPHVTPCWPVIGCKVNDLECLFYVKIRYRRAPLDS